MLRYRGRRLIRAGFIGATLIILVIVVGLAPETIYLQATSVRLQAVFAEAGGLEVGNDVKVSGVTVGKVTRLALDDGTARATLSVDGSVELGSQTAAHIRTGSLLGQRIVTLESQGSDRLRPLAVIPVSRTGSPYSLTEAVGDLTTAVAGTDTESLNQSLDTLASTMDRIAPQLGPTLDGLTRLSRSLNSRDKTLSDLLKNAADVAGILAARSQKINALILNANDLLAVLTERRQAIVELLSATSAVARELSGLVADNEKQLAPALQKINSVTALLEKNRDNIAKALPGLAKYQLTQGEAVSNGPAYNAYVPNGVASFMQPFLDYAFGFRRGTDAGQPPDNAGPRAEFPWPFNAIPGGSR